MMLPWEAGIGSLHLLILPSRNSCRESRNHLIDPKFGDGRKVWKGAEHRAHALAQDGRVTSTSSLGSYSMARSMGNSSTDTRTRSMDVSTRLNLHPERILQKPFYSPNLQ